MNNATPNPDPTNEPPAFNREKRLALVFSLAFLGAVFWPIQENWRQNPQDDFPLSYYPMFSNKREAIEDFWYLVARDTEGKRYYVPYNWIGNGGGNQVRRQIRKIMSEGHAPELAQTVARRLARRNDAPWSQVVSVAVVRGKYSVDDFFHGKKAPVSEKIGGLAQVERKVL